MMYNRPPLTMICNKCRLYFVTKLNQPRRTYCDKRVPNCISPKVRLLKKNKKIIKVTRKNSGIDPHCPRSFSVINRNNKDEQDKSEIRTERINEMNVQMLSKNIYNQLFCTKANHIHSVDSKTVNKCKAAMDFHGINIEECPKLPEVDFKLPKLVGSNILDHFYNIGEQLSRQYRDLIEKLVECEPPSIPNKWVFKPGWYKYDNNCEPVPVEYPPDDALVFDVEVCMTAGTNPTLACAISPKSWYGWVSKQLVFSSTETPDSNQSDLDDLIPLESSSESKGFNLSTEILKPKIIVGHNVSFDRARIKEQYWMERTGARFLDTMAVHVCISGVTSYQRSILKSKNKETEPEDEDWKQISSLNSLTEVHKLYCGTEISKEPRDIFIEGTLADVKDNFEDMMTYCAGDVLATMSVLKCMYPMFQERFPHPVTLAGMLELGTAYLPVNSNWDQYINCSDLAYEDIELETKLILARKADEACKMMHGDKYKKDMWMWDQDWSIRHLKMNKSVTKKKPKSDILNSKISKNQKKVEHNEKVDFNNEITLCEQNETSDYFNYEKKCIQNVMFEAERKSDDQILNESEDSCEITDSLEKKFSDLFATKNFLPAVRPLLPGYPAWYRKLCTKSGKVENWTPGPVNISTSMQITPKLLCLTWEGYPLHYIRGHGWGFLVPFKNNESIIESDSPTIPIESLVKNCPVVEYVENVHTDNKVEFMLDNLQKDVEDDISKQEFYSKLRNDKTQGTYQGTGVWSGVILSDCCYFMRLPHKDGKSKRVGNPLSKDFLNKFSENVLSGSDEEAQKVLKAGRMLSYWRNNRNRIKEQILFWLPEQDIPQRILESNDSFKRFGAILPQVVVCGTLTRRAMEPTWMTASNADSERIGSELRSMVQSPPTYSIVGADVDSQELWIAAILGDSQYKIHGATPFGWMTLSGSKAAGTDLHSHTAAAAKITRHHAKVLNYARIYGAGQNFSETLLKQFNPSISDQEAKSKSQKMFSTTKGKKIWKLKEEYIDLVFNEGESTDKSLVMSSYQAVKIAKACSKTVEEMFEKSKWIGGTESDMFNQLEEIAGSAIPRTPFLNCQLTRALTVDGEFRKRQLPTAVNWVVQSGAVDFLHLMLVNMAWLTGSKARFCLSFHDEIRYLVPNEFRYNVALALHITNLYTRAFCAKKLGFDDLPQSVAFFSSVEVDTVLRKEANLDCITPSNPHGLSKGYGIPSGESLDIWQTLDKCDASLGKLYVEGSDEIRKKVQLNETNIEDDTENSTLAT